MYSKTVLLNAALFLIISIVIGYMLKEIYIHLIFLLLTAFTFRCLKKTMKENVNPMNKHILITGCDTGFGFDLAVRMASLNVTVYAGCLFPEGLGANELRKIKNNLHVLHLDVTKDNHVKDAVRFVEKKTEKLWAVVNNAAIRRDLDIELIPLEQMKTVAEVNLYGMVRVTKAFIPLVRKSKGRIINVTSVNGRIAVPQAVSYTVTKYAAEAFSDILRREMARFGVKVVIIEPGHFGGSTAMLNKNDCDLIEQDLKELWRNVTPEIQRLYGWEYIQDFIKACREDGVDGCHTTTPVIDAMVDAVLNTRPQYRYLVHGSNRSIDIWNVAAILNSYLPESVMDWWIRRLVPLPPIADER